MPFVTEEIWSHMPGERGLLAAGSWPVVNPELMDESSEQAVGRMIAAVTAMRRYRDDVGAPAAARIPAVLEADGYDGAIAEQSRGWPASMVVERRLAEGVASISVPGGGQGARDRGDRPEEAAKRLAAHREKLDGRDQARGGEARQREVRVPRAGRGGRRRAGEARALPG